MNETQVTGSDISSNVIVEVDKYGRTGNEKRVRCIFAGKKRRKRKTRKKITSFLSLAQFICKD